MNLSEYTTALLDDIERRIDPEVEDDYYAQWKSFWYEQREGLLFTPKRKKTSAPGVELKAIHINDALHDFELTENDFLNVCIDCILISFIWIGL